MAKKKIETLDTSKNVNDVFNSMFNDSVKQVIDTDNLPDSVVIPSGIELLDIIIGGGFQTGTYASLAAPAASGKSTLALEVVSNFKKIYPDGFVIHIDSEQTMLDHNRFRLLDIDIDNDPRIKHVCFGATVEQVFNIVGNFIALKEKLATEYKDPSIRNVPTIIVWDSLDSSPCQKEKEVEEAAKATGQKAKTLKFCINKYLSEFRRYNILFITINHIVKKLEMEMFPTYDGRMAPLKDFTIAGGQTVVYAPSTLLFMRGREATKADKELLVGKYGLEESAFRVEVTTMKCKSFSYNMTVTLIFEPTYGFNNFATKLYNLQQDNYFIPEGRSFRLFEDSEFKFAIQDVKELYETEPKFKEEFDKLWNNYINDRFGKYITLLDNLTKARKQMDLTGISDGIKLDELKEITKESSDNNEVSFDLDQSEE